MAIKLQPEAKERLIASIRRYASENLDEEMGDLKAGLLLDFCLQEIGASVYNQAIRDAQAYMTNKVEEMEGTCYETEFAYWKKSSK
jgi:uncharacterized protein (DUF2164 family)